MKKFVVPIFAFIFAVTCLFGCGKKPDTSSVQAPVAESVDETAKVLENLFDKSPGVIAQMLGEPSAKTEPSAEENDAWSHQTWTYAEAGITLDMVDRGSGYVVSRVTAANGRAWGTRKEVFTGDAESKVRGAYGDLINEDYTFIEMGNIVVGQPSNCIVFHIRDEIVETITVGELG